MRKSHEEEKPEMSEQMLKSLKNEIIKSGIIFSQQKTYYAFLNTVSAMLGDTVIEYPNSQIDSYRQKYIVSHEHGLNDTMVFDDRVKIYFTDEKGTKKYTGYFCPRSFWDFVLESKLG